MSRLRRRAGSRRAPAACARGFTLLEVLAAIALLAIAFAIGLSALGGAARNARRAAALDTAVERAQTLLAQQGLTAPLESGTHSGTFKDGMAWKLQVRRVQHAAPATANAGAPADAGPQGGMMLVQASAIDLYRLDVAVQYGDHHTLRLATERAQAAQEPLQ